MANYKTLYSLCKEEFAKVPFEPLDVDVIIKRINENLEENIKI